MKLRLIFFLLISFFFSGCKFLKIEGIQSEIEKCDINYDAIKEAKIKTDNEDAIFYAKRDKVYLFQSKRHEYFVKIMTIESKQYFQILSSHENFTGCIGQNTCEQANSYFEGLTDISKKFLANLGCSANLNIIKITDFEKNRQGFKSYSDNFENDILYY